MPQSFTTILYVENRAVPAAILPALRRNGMHYEVNAEGYPRFFMRWTELGRYDALPTDEGTLPYALVLAASDAIERQVGKR